MPHSPYVTEIVRRANSLEKFQDLRELIDGVKEKKLVLLGESTHGTQEFYHWRRLITQELIELHGFDFVAVEGDWPPCSEVNRYIHHQKHGSSFHALSHFSRWPTWMWANTEMVEFVEWLQGRDVGFYGLDVYSLFESMDIVLENLRKIDPDLAQKAGMYYSCFDPFDKDEKEYMRSLFDYPEGCSDAVLSTLVELLKLRLDGSKKQEDLFFDAKMNAHIVQNATSYYSLMAHGEDSWNVRENHMAQTLEFILHRYGPEAKGIIWAHNTHVGDYNATNMVRNGYINIGGLCREKYGKEKVALVGFSTYAGEVVASHAWDGVIDKMTVPHGKDGSVEGEFHDAISKVGCPNYYILLDEDAMNSILAEERGHRAIGVVYDPIREHRGNYVPTHLARRYDAFIFIDQTSALTPLKVNFDKEKIPLTYPVGRM